MTINGIDVSYHQGLIDWKKVAQSGIEFAIIRAGYGKSNVDKKFIENIVGAHTAGLKIGIYWFIYALNEDDAIKNADFCARTIEPYKDIITMKVAADWEYDSDNYSIKNGVRQTTESRTHLVRAFLERLKSKGYEVCNYANPDYLKGKFGDLNEYPLWLAKYSVSMGDYQPWMWQHSSKGTVPGIKVPCDLDIAFMEESVKEIEYYPIPEFTLIDSLNKIGVESTYINRRRIAKNNGMPSYSGTAEENLNLLDLLNNGKLVK